MMVVRQQEEDEEREDEEFDSGSGSEVFSDGSGGSGSSSRGHEIGRPTPRRLAATAATAASVAGLLLVAVVYYGFHGGARYTGSASANLRGMEGDIHYEEERFGPQRDDAPVMVPGGEAMDDRSSQAMDDNGNGLGTVGVNGYGLVDAPATELHSADSAQIEVEVETKCGALFCSRGSVCCGNDRICCDAGSTCGGAPGERVCLAADSSPGPTAAPGPQVGADRKCGHIWCSLGSECVDGVCGAPGGTRCGETEICGKDAVCCGSSCCAPEAGCVEAAGTMLCGAPVPRDAIVALAAPKAGADKWCGREKCSSPDSTCVNGICGAAGSTECGLHTLCGAGAICCGNICCAPGGRCGGMEEAPICLAS